MAGYDERVAQNTWRVASITYCDKNSI